MPYESPQTLLSLAQGFALRLSGRKSLQRGRSLIEGEPSESHSPQRVKGRDRKWRKCEV